MALSEHQLGDFDLDLRLAKLLVVPSSVLGLRPCHHAFGALKLFMRSFELVLVTLKLILGCECLFDLLRCPSSGRRRVQSLLLAGHVLRNGGQGTCRSEEGTLLFNV